MKINDNNHRYKGFTQTKKIKKIKLKSVLFVCYLK